MKSEKELCYKFRAPLNIGDTENQTYGCRHSNPDICGNANLEEICAFVRNDNICKRPSASWRKQYLKLKEEQL